MNPVPQQSAAVCPHCGRHDAAAAAVFDAQTFVRQMKDGQDLLRAFEKELGALCTVDAAVVCTACPRIDACHEMVTSVVTRLLNAATDQVRDEQAYMNASPEKTRHRRHFAEHKASHDLILNDLGSYAMDCGRLPPADLIDATSLLLKYWTVAHADFHDATLCRIAVGE